MAASVSRYTSSLAVALNRCPSARSHKPRGTKRASLNKALRQYISGTHNNSTEETVAAIALACRNAESERRLSIKNKRPVPFAGAHRSSSSGGGGGGGGGRISATADLAKRRRQCSVFDIPTSQQQ